MVFLLRNRKIAESLVDLRQKEHVDELSCLHEP